MKANHRIPLLIAALNGAVCFTVGYAQTPENPNPLPSATTSTVTPAPPGPDTAPSATTATAVNPPLPGWADIKDDTFDQRAHFIAGVKQLEAKVNGQVAELVAKRATMKGSTRTEEWDFAMKEMENARTYLKSVSEELSKATRPTWDQWKDKIGQAWVRTQEAYGKVKASTTS